LVPTRVRSTVAQAGAAVRRFGSALTLLAGAALFAFLLHEVGLGAVTTMLEHLSWRLPVLLVFPFVLIAVFDTLGWRYAFAGDRVPFATLFTTRLAGEAVNVSTPTASVGGEAVKAWMIRDLVPMSEGLSSVIVAKTTITIAQGLFLLLGLVGAWAILDAGSTILVAMLWMLGIETFCIVGFIAVQIGGAGLLGRFRLLRAAGLESAGRLSDALLRFYREQPGRLALSIAWHLAGWIVSAAETYLILAWLGSPVSLGTALVIEAIGTGIRFATFMVPGHLGVLEGGQVMTFVALGLPGAAAMSFSLVRRLREAAWVGLGFVLVAVGHRPARAEA
jgi:uncharacterized protein (TIRG00374 family)